MSILKYDSYTFSPTPEVTISQDPVGKPDGAIQGMRETWRVRGKLLGAQASLITQKSALIAAVSVNGKDLTLYRDNGTTVMHQLLNSGLAGGTHIVQTPSFPEGAGAVFATYLPYEFVAQGVRLVSDKLANNAWGECTTSQFLDPQKQLHRVIQGWYAGSGAQAAADAAKQSSGVVVVHEEQTTSDAESRVTFRYEYIVTASSRSVISWVETVTKNTAFSTKVFRKRLGGSAPTRQTTVLNEVVGVQEGAAVGLSAYPDFPDPLWLEDDMSAPPVYVRECPERGPDDTLTKYKIRWRFTFAWATNPSVLYPNVPPA